MLYDAYGHPIYQAPPDHGLEQGYQKKHSESAEEQTTTKASEPPQRPVNLDYLVSAPKGQSNSYEEKHYRLQKRGLWIQALLCIFTALAFGAAAYYAHVANRQAKVMQRQLEATDRPWVKVAAVEPIRDLAFDEERGFNKPPRQFRFLSIYDWRQRMWDEPVPWSETND